MYAASLHVSDNMDLINEPIIQMCSGITCARVFNIELYA